MGGPVSIDATRWAWTVPVNNSSQRLVLLSLADRAGEEHTAWPSIERLAKDTVLDKKTVQKVILELIKLGLVEDTGERTGPTKRVRVLKLKGVNGREDMISHWDESIPAQNVKLKGNNPKNGNIKQSQKRDDLAQKNTLECGDPAGEERKVQNQSRDMSLKLIEEHEWVPDVDQLVTKLKMAGHESNVDLIIGLPRFEFELSAFNSHFDNQVLSDSKKLHKFTAWIVDKFERYQKQNPNYGASLSEVIEQPSFTAPAIDLPTKPKGLLGNL